jgi:alanyl aminopeptidase
LRGVTCGRARLAGSAAFVGVVFMSFPNELRAEKSRERLARDLSPDFQSVSLRLDPDETAYTGSFRTELTVRQAVSSFTFHAEEMALLELTLRGDAGIVPLSYERSSDDMIRVRVATPLAPGAWVLEGEFSNEFGTRASGFYRLDYGGEGYVYTQFEADAAREAFPCWDEPIFKIPYQITVTAKAADTVVSNTPPESVTERDGWRTTVFSRTKPLPSYLLAVACGPFDSIPIPGLDVEGRILAPSGQAHLAEMGAEMTPPILSALEEYFGTDYPFEKLDFIAVPEFWPGAMEHPGAVTFRAEGLLLDSSRSTAAERSRLARWIAHELAHMWFGNLVTMEWWDDLWLNEAFADWMGDKIVEQVHPELGVRADELRRSQASLADDARPSARAIRRDFSPGDDLMENLGVTYAKGKLVLEMFEGWLGAETFRRGVKGYLSANARGNANAGDLWRSLEAVAGAKVADAMASFLEQPGVPRVDVEVLGRRVRLTQSRMRAPGEAVEELAWKLPVLLRFGAQGKSFTDALLLEETTLEVELPGSGEIEWLYPNANAAAYYRWSLSGDWLTRLLAHSEELTSRERVELLGNLGALLDAGALRGSEYLGALATFAKDGDPQVVHCTLEGFEQARETFVTEELELPFAAFVRTSLAAAVERFGLEPGPSDSELVRRLRPELWKWVGGWGREQELREHARALADAYLEGRQTLDPEVLEAALELAALDGGEDLFEEFQERFESAQMPSERSRFLPLLGNFRDTALQERALSYVRDGPLRTQEVFTIPRQLIETERGRERVFAWLLEHFEWIAERVPPESAGSVVALAGGCSCERVEKAGRFFEERKERIPGLEARLARLRDRSVECTRLRQAEGESVKAYLSRSAEGESALGRPGRLTRQR